MSKVVVLNGNRFIYLFIYLKIIHLMSSASKDILSGHVQGMAHHLGRWKMWSSRAGFSLVCLLTLSSLFSKAFLLVEQR